MALDPVTAGIDLVSTLVNKFFPDKSAQEQAQLAATLTVIQGQLNANTAEAASSNVFTSGWRPFIGWVCGCACAWNWIGISIATFTFKALNHPIVFSAADTTDMLPLLFGMLGLGGLRTYEKVKGVA